MSEHISGSNHKAWAENNLKDFGDFAECVEYVSQSEYGDGQLEGEWYYAESDWENEESRDIPDGQKRGVIYFGTFGNDNSPGASHYTHAEVYDDEDEYLSDLSKWEARDEYLGSEYEDDEDNEEEDSEPLEPDEDDYTTEDHIHFFQYGKLVVTVPMTDEFCADDWRPHVRRHMEENQFWPNVWFVSDHGNAHLLSFED